MGGEDPFGNSGMTLGNVGKVKLLLLPSLMHLKSYIYIYIWLAPMVCWNFSGDLDFHMGHLVHERLPTTVFSKTLVAVERDWSWFTGNNWIEFSISNYMWQTPRIVKTMLMRCMIEYFSISSRNWIKFWFWKKNAYSILNNKYVAAEVALQTLRREWVTQ